MNFIPELDDVKDFISINVHKLYFDIYKKSCPLI